jgi:hypothetical protein
MPATRRESISELTSELAERRGFHERNSDMVKTFKLAPRILRKPAAIIATGLLLGLCGQAWARSAEPGQSVITSRGPAFVTGHLGALETTTVPGSVGQGLLMNNGNGTSTLIVPGGVPQTVATPR